MSTITSAQDITILQLSITISMYIHSTYMAFENCLPECMKYVEQILGLSQKSALTYSLHA